MSFIAKNLIPEEKILFHTKKHWIIFFAPVFWTCVTIFFLWMDNPYLHKLVVFPAALTVIFWINQTLVFWVSEFAVTNIRVMMREGYIIRHTNDTRLSTLANVTVNQSLVGQALNYGTVFINSFGGESDPFREINRPTEFQRALQAQLYAMKQQVQP